MGTIVLAAWAVAALMAAGSAEAGAVQVKVSGVGAKGDLFVQFCTDAEYGNRCALAAKVAPHAGETVVTFPAVKPGVYLAGVFQDVDGNGLLGFGMTGAPSEPWGYSRGAKGVRGPAAFKDAAVNVGPGGAVIPVTLGLR